MKITTRYKIRRILDLILIVPEGPAVWKKNAVLPVSESGLLLWEMLAAGADLDSLEKAVMEEFEVDPATARRDILRFLKELDRRELLSR